MKNSLLISAAVALLVFSGCRKIGEFKINDSSEFTVPQSAVVGVPLPAAMAVTTSSKFEFESNGTDTKHIKEVKLDQLTLTISQPASQNFDFLNSIHIYISASGLAEVELAYLDNVPLNVGSISLLTTGVELDEYIKKDSYQLRIQTVTDELLSQDVTIKSDMTFKVKAKIL